MGLILSLGFIGVLAGRRLLQINQHAAVAHYTPPPAPPEPTATAAIRPVTLPTGTHFHADLAWPADAAPTAALAWAIPVAAPTPVSPHATRVVIPAIGVDAPVLHGTDTETLKRGVGHYSQTANPGESGNLVLTGHDDIYGEVFRYLPNLRPGDAVTVYTAAARYQYVIRGSRIVAPTQISVLDPTLGPTLTLITCYPYLIDNQRIVVVGDLVSESSPGG